jgi:PAS domain S-box-containing protein
MMNTKLDIKPSINILLVEDNPGDVVIFKEHLKYSGINYELTISGTLRDALHQTAEHQFDVILLDLGLPDSISLNSLKSIQSSNLKAPVIIMTGLDDEDTALLSLKEGAQDYLVKSSLNTENIVRSIRYSIERKKIQEIQKKNTRQFSTLAAATALINEADDIPSIYKISCDNIKSLLNEPNVFTIEYFGRQTPYTAYYEWLVPFFDEAARRSGIDFYQINVQIIDRVQKLLEEHNDGKLYEIEESIYGLLNKKYGRGICEKISNTLGFTRIYLLGFSRSEEHYGGMFIFSKAEIEPDDVNIIEVIGNQTSLNIHRRTVEMQLVLSEQRYRLLNKELEQRVIDRTKDLAKTNNMLENELEISMRLEEQLTRSRDELEIRVRERTAALEKSELRFHNMFYNHEAVMWLVKPETGVIIEANKSAEQFYGYPFNTSKQFNVRELNMFTKDEIKEHMSRAVNGVNNYFIFTHKLASGEFRIVEVYSSPIEINNETLLFSVIHDITRRSQIEEALKESESLYKALVNNSLNIILISADSMIEFTNHAASEFCASPQDKIIGKNIDELFKTPMHDVGQHSVSSSILEAARDNRAVEIQLQNANNTFSCFLLRSNSIKYKGKQAFMSILTDITENKNIEQYVLNKVIETEENDRKQFAADLHDDLGPILSTIKLRLGLMEKVKDSGELQENIAISNELMGLVVEKIRTISHNITPHLIESLGLEAAVHDLCNRITNNSKMVVEFDSKLKAKRFSQPVELHYYRIISELVNNSIKHSGATKIHINLRSDDETLTLVYFDNGKGYNMKEGIQMSGGIGLRSIQNRVSLINGTIDVQINKGATVVKIIKKLDMAVSEFPS